MSGNTPIKSCDHRSILFNGPMVRAILEGWKTQTRRTRGLGRLNDSWYRDRIDKVECRDGLWHFWELGHGSSALPVFTARCPYGQPGDRLWVKETHGFWCHSFESVGVQYAAGGEDQIVYFPDEKGMPTLEVQTRRNRDGSRRMRPSIHMPRWASRIDLENSRIRVERLQDIREVGAKKEGIKSLPGGGYGTDEPFSCENTARDAFQSLWESINGLESWDENPWVWVIEFRRKNPCPEELR